MPVKWPRWTFDDYHLGVSDTGRCLNSRILQRPPTMTRQDWYKLAGGMCRRLNNDPEKMQ